MMRTTVGALRCRIAIRTMPWMRSASWDPSMSSSLSESAASSIWAASWMLVTGAAGASASYGCPPAGGRGPNRAVRAPSGHSDVHGRAL